MDFRPRPGACKPLTTINIEPTWTRWGSCDDESIVVPAAWAIVLGRYLERDDVEFKIAGTVEERVAAAPLRVTLDKGETVTEYIRRVKEACSKGDRHVPADSAIQDLQTHGSRSEESSENVQLSGDSSVPKRQHSTPTYILDFESIGTVRVTCDPGKTGFRFSVAYDDTATTELQVTRVLHQFLYVLDQLEGSRQTEFVGEVDMLCPHDEQEIHQWNNYAVHLTTHDIPSLLSVTVKTHPQAPAICSWDGNYNYAELDAVTTRLSWYFRELGIGTETIVPVCFDKSALAVIVKIAIHKAGGAYVALQPDHPEARLKDIISAVDATIVITEPRYADVFSGWGVDVAALDHTKLASLANATARALPKVPATSAAVVICTSGSTGRPKTIVIEHYSLCATVMATAAKCDIGPGSRIFQFASYIFDVSIGDIFTAMASGACLCIPSPDDRMDMVDVAINKLNATVAFLTPTVASLLLPEDVPCLECLVLGGEPITKENVRDWSRSVRLHFFYGPAETTIHCSGTQAVHPDAEPTDLGLAHAAKHWIVDRHDHNKLVPVGCVGEILVEGPVVARGYLKDPEKTSAAFVECPRWASAGEQGGGGKRGRFYKTGDLARYAPSGDGAMRFVGRKDNQVKVRGHRVELGEVESHLYSHERIRHAVAAVPAEGPWAGHLVAMLSLRESQAFDGPPPRARPAPVMIRLQSRLRLEALRDLEVEVREHLQGRLPAYMIPSSIVVVDNIPFNSSGKICRREVRMWFEALGKAGTR